MGNAHPFPDLINILQRNFLLTRAGMDYRELGAIMGESEGCLKGPDGVQFATTLMRNGSLFLQVCVHCK